MNRNKEYDTVLGQILLKSAIVEGSDIAEAVEQQQLLSFKNVHVLIGELLVKKGIISRDQLKWALAEQVKLRKGEDGAEEKEKEGKSWFKKIFS